MSLIEITSCPEVSDFPEGGFWISVEGESKETSVPCEVCKGVRKAMTILFRMNIQKVIVEDVEMTWAEFCKRYPETGGKFTTELNVGNFASPVCIACQEDFYLPGKHSYTIPSEE